MKKWVFPAIVVAVIAAALIVWKRPAQGDAEPAPTANASTGIVQFRMEQQWLIHMKLALAQEAELPPQVYSTGRVIAAPANRALVAPPVGGIIDTRPLPQASFSPRFCKHPPPLRPPRFISKTAVWMRNGGAWPRRKLKLVRA